MIPLELVKEHLRIVDDSENRYLEGLTLAAIKLFERQTSRILVRPRELPKDEPRAVELDDLITLGILLMVSHWYENREATSTQTISEIPLGIAACWGPHRFYNVR